MQPRLHVIVHDRSQHAAANEREAEFSRSKWSNEGPGTTSTRTLMDEKKGLTSLANACMATQPRIPTGGVGEAPSQAIAMTARSAKVHPTYGLLGIRGIGPGETYRGH